MVSLLSQFDEFIDLLIENGKEFLVIGSQTAPTEKSIIRHFQEGNIRVGYHYHLSGFNGKEKITVHVTKGWSRRDQKWVSFLVTRNDLIKSS